MSASVRESDHGPSKDEPLKYAPKKARLPNPDLKPDAPDAPPTAPPADAAPADNAAPRPSEPPWRRSRQRGAFAGDVAIAELRTKLALAPDRLPEPPPPSLGNTKLIWAGRIAGVAVVALVGFAGYRWGSSPSARLQLFHHAPRQAPDRSLTAVNLNQGSDPVQSATGGATLVNAVYPPPKPPASQPSRRLAVGNIASLQTDEVARLTISAGDPSANAAVVIGGLVPGSMLSTGREVSPNTWRLSSGELAGAFITPPRGFAGTMDLTLELRLADNSVADRKGLQLEWGSRGSAAIQNPVIARAQSRQHDAAEIAQMVRRGAELMANGDVAAARLMYQRAAEAGEAVAAFALAETYDPLVLKGGVPPDVGLAHAWYERAKELGSTMAPERLDRLTRLAE